MTGARDHIKPIDADIWVKAMQQKSCPAPPFYPRAFENAATLENWNTFHMRREDITVDNCRDIYIHLINNC